MNLISKRNELPLMHKILILYLIFQTLLVRWAINKDFFKYISIIIFAILIKKTYENSQVKLLDIVFLGFYGGVTILNIIFNGIHSHFLNNFYTNGLANIFIIIYFAILNIENKEALKKFILNDLFIILNSYFLINIPIIMKQLGGTHFLMRFYSNNPMYKDHITGLIGSSGTHELTFFWIALIIINIYRFALNKNKGLLIFIIVEILFMFVISSKNDNTAFFLIFPFLIAQYLFKYVLYASKKELKNIFIIVLICFISLFALYNFNKDIRNFMDTRVAEKLEQYGLKKIPEKKIKQNKKPKEEERLMLYKMALEKGNGYGFGKGIGSILSYGEKRLHKHFGMSEISFRVYEGGIIYFLALILVFTQMLNKLLDLKKLKFLGFIVIAIDLTLLAVYTMVFRYSLYAIMLSLIVCVTGYNYNNENSRAEVIPIAESFYKLKKFIIKAKNNIENSFGKKAK
ncbi:hypothetical protein [Clostridium tarantellae]|uniref:O-antigen ligase domain-containing protein n=1 Tax=Clostridium tarantellae TaxID=39493 RepID=A0A6I1MJH2_9CLOT|nr:hypothetical protein [Clostridium tarantellae]MPQ43535.1 hypothetical protein [Clostridium tarantellae]